MEENKLIKIEKQKINETIMKIFNSVWFCIIIGVIIFFKTLLFYNSTVAISEALEAETIIGTLSFIIVLICFLSVLTNRARVTITIIIDILLSILIFADNVYYVFSNSFLSVAQISNLQYGGEIMSSLPTLLNIKQIWYFIDIIIIALLLLVRILKLEKKPKSTKKQIVAKCVTFAVGIAIFIFVGVKFIEKDTQKLYNKDMQMREATIFGYHIYDIENAINIKSKTKYKDYNMMIEAYNELKMQYNEEYGEIQYDLQGILKDKNVIILQLESVQEFVVNKEINGTEITPNLNKFLAENIEFTNMHMQSYSTTADSEHSTITSLYPMENGMAFSKYYTNTYDDIFKIFNNANYFTSYMHGNYPYFWNRGNVYGRLGLDDLSLKEQFSDLSENINGDLSDELLYRQAVEKLEQFDKPFISFIVTASSHTPFTLEGLQDRSKLTVDVGEYKGTVFGNYIEAVNYADYAFGIFIDELKEAELYEDTAILVFGDHNGLSMYNEDLTQYLKSIDGDVNDIDLKLNYTRVLCGFKIPGVESLKVEKPVNKLDIKPSLAYLCDVEDGFSLGTNMFASKDFVALNNERIISEKYYYDENWYDIQTGEIINMDDLDEETKNLLNSYYQKMEEELDISNSVIVNNLLQ